MPFIQTKTNVAVSAEQESALKTAFGNAIQLIHGKTEQWLILDFCDNERMWFSGDDSPTAFLEVKLFGSATESACYALTAKLTQIVSQELSIPTDRIYVKYEEVRYWGWNGSNF